MFGVGTKVWHIRAWSAWSALFVVACSAGHGASGGGATCSDIPKVRGPAESCCRDYGIDACGPMLFCAALDGRTVAACYPVNSRMDGETCTSDNQCVSRSCNLMAGKCKSTPSTKCTGDLGCGSDPDGTMYVCFKGQCAVVGDGSYGSACAKNSDCSSMICDPQTASCASAKLPNGKPCNAPVDCASGVCEQNTCWGNLPGGSPCTETADCMPKFYLHPYGCASCKAPNTQCTNPSDAKECVIYCKCGASCCFKGACDQGECG